MLCPGRSEEEVHYICALLNSIPALFIVKSYGIETSISSHIFKYLSIERFDEKEKTHRSLVANSKALHKATAEDDREKVQVLEFENLEFVAEYWGLEKSEVADIKGSLEDLT
jgi:hypothetical protein